MSTRIYEVLMGGHVHLVEAKTQAQAVAHVTRKKVSVKVLSAVEAVKFMAEGHKVEVAGAEHVAEEPAAASAGGWPVEKRCPRLGFRRPR